MAKTIHDIIEQTPDDLEIGKTYLFHSVKFDYVGVLAAVPGPYMVILTQASWVANSGRLSDFMREGKADGMEIEPVGKVCTQWIHWSPWPHKLFDKAV